MMTIQYTCEISHSQEAITLNHKMMSYSHSHLTFECGAVTVHTAHTGFMQESETAKSNYRLTRERRV